MEIYDPVESSKQVKKHLERAEKEHEASLAQAEARKKAEKPAGLAAAESEVRRVAEQARKIASHHAKAEAAGRAYLAGRGKDED